MTNKEVNNVHYGKYWNWAESAHWMASTIAVLFISSLQNSCTWCVLI